MSGTGNKHPIASDHVFQGGHVHVVDELHVEVPAPFSSGRAGKFSLGV